MMVHFYSLACYVKHWCCTHVQLSGEEDIVIAKMDATANDVPSPYSVRG